MPRIVDQNELKKVEEVVARFPNGASLSDITDALAGAMTPRVIQRRLAKLIELGRLIRMGHTKGAKYTVASAATTPITSEHLPGRILDTEEIIPLSKEALSVRAKIRRPFATRTPVSYNRAFLDAYSPNETHYLSQAIRSHLSKTGESHDGNLPAGTYARQILGRLLIDLSWNSSRLEGNTYSLLETQRLLEVGETAIGKDTKEAQMILNHKAAIEFLIEDASEIAFNSYTIKNLHALLSDNLLPDPMACGRLRSSSVGITHSVYTPLAVPQLIEEIFTQMLAAAEAIDDPFEQAFFMLVHLPYLQPFDDVNKRVSRLAANIPLIKKNLCPLSFVDVPQKPYIEGMLAVYEINRIELLRDVFVWSYERSAARYSSLRQSLGEPDPFRLRYRSLVAEAVDDVVRNVLGKLKAAEAIRHFADARVDEPDRARFVEVVETELLGLHEGNIARYRLRPSEFSRWQAAWT